MKENADKHLDDLSRKVIGRSSLESPSFDFTHNVMAQVKAIAGSKITTYKPLISKSMWLVIALLVTSGIGYIVFGPKSESLWLQKLQLDDYMHIPSFDTNIDVSQTTLYVFVLFAIMFSIQIPLLKHQLNKRFK